MRPQPQVDLPSCGGHQVLVRNRKKLVQIQVAPPSLGGGPRIPLSACSSRLVLRSGSDASAAEPGKPEGEREEKGEGPERSWYWPGE